MTDKMKMPEVGKVYKKRINNVKCKIVDISDYWITIENYPRWEGESMSLLNYQLFYDTFEPQELIEEIPSDKVEEIISEIYISGRGLCFIVNKDKKYNIGDFIKKDEVDYIALDEAKSKE